MTGKEAIEQVLTGKRKPMPAKDITAAAQEIAQLGGKTPEATLAAILYTQAKRDDGLVLKTGRGEFKLNPKRRKDAPPLEAEPEPATA